MDAAFRSVWGLVSATDVALGLLFLSYVSSIVAFGVYYYSLFKADNSEFFFMRDMQKWQLRRARTEVAQRLRHHAVALPLYRDLRKAAATGDITGEGTFTLSSGRRIRVTREAWEEPGRFEEWSEMSELKANGTRRMISQYGPAVPDASNIAQWIEQIFSHHTRAFERLTKRQTELRHTPHRAWTLRDFIYFSAMTQMTAGYGDIMPNSARVRMIVVAQALFGYVLLVFVLSAVVS